MRIFLKKVIFKRFLRKSTRCFLLCKNGYIFFVKPEKFAIEIL